MILPYHESGKKIECGTMFVKYFGMVFAPMLVPFSSCMPWALALWVPIFNYDLLGL